MCGTGCQSIDHGEADYGKEIGHLAHRHGVGAVAHDAEYAEQPDSYANARFALEVVEHENHVEHQKEDGNADENEGEIEVTPVTLAEIKKVYDGPHNCGVECKECQHVSETYVGIGRTHQYFI